MPVPNSEGISIQVRDEIRRLRSGRGVHTPDLTRRMGTHLRILCGVHDDTPELRAILIQRILACAGALPDDQQDALAIGLAIDTDIGHLVKFTDRVEYLATRLSVSPRTAQRRIEDAETRLADEIAAELARGAGGDRFVKSYYVHGLRTVVDNTGVHADPPIVVVHQERSIVAVVDNLGQVPIRLELPDHPEAAGPVFSVRVQHGGRVREPLRRVSPTGFEFVIGLPAPLAACQRHRFGLSFTFPARLVRAHHAITGEVTIRRFLLIVKFHPEHRPAWIREVHGEDIRTLDAFAHQASPPYGGFQLDAVSEANLEFDHLSPHLAYGCQWRWPATEQDPS